MSKYIYLLLLLSCLIDVGFSKSAIVQQSQIKYFEDHFNKTIECIKTKLTVGIPGLGIPPMNPWRKDETIDLRLDNKYIWTKVKLSNMYVDGLVSFKAASITLSPLMKLDIKYHLEKLRARVSYVGDFNFLGLLLIYGDGTANVQLEDIEVQTTTQFQMVPPLIGDYRLTLSLGKSEVNVSGINNDETLSEYFSEIASQFTSIFINTYKNDITNFLSPLIKQELNSYIGDFAFLEYLAMITKYSCD